MVAFVGTGRHRQELPCRVHSKRPHGAGNPRVRDRGEFQESHRTGKNGAVKNHSERREEMRTIFQSFFIVMDKELGAWFEKEVVSLSLIKPS